MDTTPKSLHHDGDKWTPDAAVLSRRVRQSIIALLEAGRARLGSYRLAGADLMQTLCAWSLHTDLEPLNCLYTEEEPKQALLAILIEYQKIGYPRAEVFHIVIGEVHAQELQLLVIAGIKLRQQQKEESEHVSEHGSS